MKPLIKWAGGKSQLIPQIEQYLPAHIDYYAEPFVGGAALLFHLAPQHASINDFNSEISNLYIQVKDNCDLLIKELKKSVNEEEYYYQIRNWDRKTGYNRRSLVKLAFRTLYLNKTCYNGLFRKNSKGYFNTPYGHYAKMNFDFENIRACSEYLRENNIQVSNGDFEHFIDNLNDCFIYADPPYYPLNPTSFTSYSEMDWSDEGPQIRLKESLERATQRGCQWMLSNSDTPFIRELFANYNIYTVQARRNINSKGNGRGYINEVLVTNY